MVKRKYLLGGLLSARGQRASLRAAFKDLGAAPGNVYRRLKREAIEISLASDCNDGEYVYRYRSNENG